jgi:hypothetical protein
MALDPYARGLWAQAFVLTLFGGDNFFVGLVPLLFHYLVGWPTMPVNALPSEEQSDFISYYAFIVGYGAINAMLAVYAMRSRVLVPTHMIQSNKPRLGIFLVVLGAVVGVRASVIRSGAANAHTELEPLTATSELIYLLAAISGFAMVATVLLMTCLVKRPKGVWSWPILTYRDNRANHVISDYIIAAAAVLLPQLAWNLLTPTLGMEPAGLITIFAEIIAWVGVYLWFTRVRKVSDVHFSRDQSYVSLFEYILVGGITHVMSGIVFLALNSVDLEPHFAHPEDAVGEWVMAISLAASVVLFFVFGTRRKRQRDATKGGADAQVPAGRQAPGRRRSYAQLTG